MRLFMIAALACLTALHAAADPLPRGQFLLGTFIWPETALPLYTTLLVEGDVLRIELSSVMALNITECDTTGDCIYSVDIISAKAEVQDGILRLSNIEIDTDPALDWREDLPAHMLYATPLLALIDGARVTETPGGLTLTSASGALQFYHTDAEARAAIRAYPFALDASIRTMAGCEVRGLAPLFTRDDLTARERDFTGALRGFAVGAQINALREQADPWQGDPNLVDDDLVRSLSRAGAIPNLIAFSATDPDVDPVEVFWADLGQSLYDEDRATFDADLARYGDTLDPLIAFLRHLQTADIPSNVCGDLSVGFLDAG